MHNKNMRPPGDPGSNQRPGLSESQGVKWAASQGSAELEQCNTIITGISETHWKRSGHFDTEKYTFYFSGNETNSFAGVAIAIPKQWNKSVLGYNPINERLISIKLSASPTPLNIIQAYSPTSTAEDKVVECFYNQLETCITKIPKKELLIVLGDFNAKIGDTSMDMSLRNTVGNYGLGIRNDRGDRLLQFATDNGMTIMNTVFKQHPRRLYTWTFPDGKHRNQIDYIIIKER
ncbi:craniofacial development protein 2-like [Temnothorax nylanderi]|uniref:craniofacial development protein 2-like n=1 Tax=Temnothorax nylanderi TaxID=102681 RepID=UPI003A86E1C9